MSQNYLIHIGNKNSGRYPRGSGENPNQHDGVPKWKNAGEKTNYNRRQRKGMNDANQLADSLATAERTKRWVDGVRKKHNIKPGTKLLLPSDVSDTLTKNIDTYLKQDEIMSKKYRSITSNI